MLLYLFQELGVQIKVFKVADTKLRKYTTQKADVEKKKFKRPDADSLQTVDPLTSLEYALIEDALCEPKDCNG